jgi:hypothetical protein
MRRADLPLFDLLGVFLGCCGHSFKEPVVSSYQALDTQVFEAQGPGLYDAVNIVFFHVEIQDLHELYHL